METLKFKTNINCGGGVKAVTPQLATIAGIASWNVDTDNPDKILTVESRDATADTIKQAVTRAGFTIEALN